MKVFQAYLEEEMMRLKDEERALRKEERKDEANHVRVRCNIFEVCGTIRKVVQQTAAPEEMTVVYLRKLDNLQVSWKESLEKAQAYGDVEKITIEEIKLQALTEIRARFCEEQER